MKNTSKKYNLSGKRIKTFALNFLMTCGKQLSPFGGVGGSLALFIIASLPPFGGSMGVAQTVCTGDSVILTLNGYRGTIQWQQSPDLSTWSPASGSGVNAVNDKLHLAATNTYYYRAAVTDGECLPFYSDTVLITVNAAPGIPATNAVSGISPESFSANWTISSDASTYYLDVATDAGFTSFVSGYNDLNVGNVSSYNVIGLVCNTTYYYRVRAANLCGTSASSGTRNTTTTASPPAAPTANIASNVAYNSFNANWTASSRATSYYLDVATDAGFTSFVDGYNDLNVGNVGTYSVTGLNCNTSYHYRVRGDNACGTGGNSGTIDVTTSASMPTVPTANAASNIAQGTFVANWAVSSNASTYHLDVAIDNGFTSFVTGYNNLNVGNVSTYNVSSLSCNTPYYYRVRASNACGTSPNSNTITVTTSSTIPATPTANAASSVTQSSFSANWSVAAEASTYYLDIATDIGFISFVTGYNNFNTGYATTYNVTGLACNTTYYYRVRASNSCGTSPNSNTVTVNVICATAPYCTLNSTCNGNITDSRDNKTYSTVQIVNQCWMGENLNVGTYVSGNTNQTSSSDNKNTSIQKYCYDNNIANCTTYGGLYQWNEMMAYSLSISTNGPGPQGICPTGWHIPTDNEWKCLEMNLGMLQSEADKSGIRGTDEGGKLKQTGTMYWTSPNTGASNSSGFTGLPGGYRDSYFGSFYGIGTYGYWWSATEGIGTYAWNRYLVNSYPTVTRNNGNKTDGYSVRCIKD